MIQLNWQEAEKKIVEVTTDAIEKFVKEYSSEVVSFFAYHLDPFRGWVRICLDTPDNARAQAIKAERQINKTWATFFRDNPEGWRDARYYFNQNRVVEYTPRLGNFKYAGIATITFQDWADYFNSADESDGDPQGHVLALMWRCIDNIAETRLISRLHQANLFRIGFQLFDSDLGLTVVRILRGDSET